MKNKEASSTVVAESSVPVRGQNLSDQQAFPSGAVVCGKVLCRTRRESTGKDGKARFNIALSILAGEGVFIVQRWANEAAPQDLPAVGQQVRIPVRIGAYLQGGLPKVRLVWDDGQSSHSF